MSTFSSSSRTLFILAAFVIVIAGLRAAESIMVTFLLSGFFAIICAPPFLLMQKKGLPAWLSLIAVVIFISLFQILLISIIGSSAKAFSGDLPIYQEKLRGTLSHIITTLGSWGVEIPQERLMETFDPSSIFKTAMSALGSLGAVLSNSFLIILTVIFMLFESLSLPNKLHKAFGEESSQMRHIQRFLDTVKTYMTIKAVISLATGAIIYLGLLIIGVDYPLLWAILAFFLNFVPNIGSIIAAIPTVLLAIIQLGPLSALFTALLYIAANMIMGNVVEPRFLGKGLGLSTLVVFLSLVFWGWVFGPVGMFLSVPLTMLLKIAFESNEETEWIAIMMGGDPGENAAKQ
jgi:predicted PurR-regulated permease PerM